MKVRAEGLSFATLAVVGALVLVGCSAGSQNDAGAVPEESGEGHMALDALTDAVSAGFSIADFSDTLVAASSGPASGFESVSRASSSLAAEYRTVSSQYRAVSLLTVPGLSAAALEAADALDASSVELVEFAGAASAYAVSGSSEDAGEVGRTADIAQAGPVRVADSVKRATAETAILGDNACR